MNGRKCTDMKIVKIVGGAKLSFAKNGWRLANEARAPSLGGSVS